MKLLALVCLLFICSGCISGTGFNKKATLMPDEVSISIDADPQDNWKTTEVTGGLKWKLN